MTNLHEIRTKTAATLFACACALGSPVSGETTQPELLESAIAAEMAILDGEIRVAMDQLQAFQLESEDLAQRILIKLEELNAMLDRAETLNALLAEYQTLQGPIAGNGSEIQQ